MQGDGHDLTVLGLWHASNDGSLTNHGADRRHVGVETPVGESICSNYGGLRRANLREVAEVDLGANVQWAVWDDVQERLRNGKTQELTRIGENVEHDPVHGCANGTLVQTCAAGIKVRDCGISQGFGVADFFLA